MDLIHLNEYDKLVITNGCRPAWLSDVLTKSVEKALKPFFNLIFKDCCVKHDIDFYFGATKSEFKDANDAFYTCMKQTIKKKSHWYSKWYFTYKAWQYHKLVSKYGWSSFQDHSVGCMDLEDLPSFRATKCRRINMECVWLKVRWYTRKEALEAGFI